MIGLIVTATTIILSSHRIRLTFPITMGINLFATGTLENVIECNDAWLQRLVDNDSI